MVDIVEVCRCREKSIEKPQYSIFQNKNLLYLQPYTRHSISYNRPYKKPTIKTESDTTYGRSYMQYDHVPKQRFNYGDHEKIVVKSTEKLESDTVYKLSYQASNGKIPKPFIPKSCLSINGSHDMTTIHMVSYMDPGCVKIKRYKPYQGKNLHLSPIGYKTVTKESYQNFAMPIVKRPRKPEFWQTKSKTDYQTTSRLSYQCIVSVVNKIHVVPKRPIISAQIEKDTVYKMSYKIPGRFVNKENEIYE
ncbi:uncharacterized protein LOC143148913 [Ptiloglossa arizonensis]|uniref:uncharacterized protein LOC143148913 n=1 Tax=Ptiloglossa arizonensis TaxID=3350558 RepID=UPI003F9F16BF